MVVSGAVKGEGGAVVGGDLSNPTRASFQVITGPYK